jgi:hypothetical protein
VHVPPAQGVRREDSVHDPHALAPRIPDAQRLKDPDYTAIDLMVNRAFPRPRTPCTAPFRARAPMNRAVSRAQYHSDRARVISDFGASNFLVTGSGIEVAGLSIIQRLAYRDTQVSAGLRPRSLLAPGVGSLPCAPAGSGIAPSSRDCCRPLCLPSLVRRL